MKKISQYAAVLLETSDGKLLFHHRDNKPDIANPDMIGVFGGGVEPGESFEEAAVREIKEELNLDLRQGDLALRSIYQKVKAIHGQDQECKVFLACNVDPQKLTLRKGEGQGIVAIGPEDDWPNYKLTVMARDILEKYFRRK